MQKHHHLTEPLLEYYNKRNILITCAGRTSDEIYPQIESELITRFGIGRLIHRESQVIPKKPSIREDDVGEEKL